MLNLCIFAFSMRSVVPLHIFTSRLYTCFDNFDHDSSLVVNINYIVFMKKFAYTSDHLYILDISVLKAFEFKEIPFLLKMCLY